MRVTSDAGSLQFRGNVIDRIVVRSRDSYAIVDPRMEGLVCGKKTFLFSVFVTLFVLSFKFNVNLELLFFVIFELNLGRYIFLLF